MVTRSEKSSTFAPGFRIVYDIWHKNMAIGQAIFRRTELLLGDKSMEQLGSKRVIIFGVGGVGSWCAESLVRSGIRHLTIVDSDRVCITNINRQLMATSKTVGQVKVEALKERLLSINPQAEITALQQIFTAETADSFDIGSYDYIIDAIDSLKDKTLLILMATQTEARFFSSMGAALKLDPTKGHNATCGTEQCMCPKAKVGPGDPTLLNHEWCTSKAQINGTLAHITAIFGFMLAGLVIQDIVKA